MSHPDAPSLEHLLTHEAWIGALARSLVTSDHDADDLVQEIYVAALTRRPRSSDPRGWVASVARNLVRSQRRGDLRRARREAEAARLEAVPSAAELVERAALHRTIVSAVLDLPDPCRTTLLYRYFEGLPPRLIARRDGVPVETVRTRLKRGRELLRSRLDDLNEGRREAWAALVLLHHGLRPVAPVGVGGALVAKTAVGVALVAAALVVAPLVLGGRDDEAPPVGVTAESKPRPVARVDAADGPALAQVPRPRDGAVATPPASVAAPVRGGLRGRVTDRRGRPVVGAAVTALAVYRGAEVWRGQGTALEELRTERTDADGRYALGRFDVPVLLRVDADGMGRRYSFVASAGRRDVVLSPGARAVGRVTDHTGTPRPGAVVVLLERDCKVNVFGFRADGAAFTWSTTISYAQGFTDVAGCFAIADVAPGRYRLAVFGRDGPVHAPDGLRLDVGEDRAAAAEIRLPAREAVTVSGVVRDIDGEPIAGARVDVSGHPTRGTTTDAHGRFRMSATSGERLSLLARKAGRVGVVDALPVPAGGLRDVALTLIRPGAIVGRVVDPAGQPVVDASVVLGGGGAPARTDDDGRFRLRGARPGRTSLVVDAGASGGCRLNDVAIDPDETTDVADVRLRPVGAIVGRIEAAPGVPVDRIGIALRAVGGRTPPVRRGASTSADGRFRIAGVGPGRYRIAAWVGGQYHTFAAVIDVVAGAESAVVLGVSSDRALAGRVVDEHGDPVFHALVEATPGDDESATDFCYSDEQGRFRLIGLDAARYRLHVESQGRHFQRTLAEVTPGVESLAIELETKTPIHGRVVLAADGRPATAFWVRAFARHDPAAQPRAFHSDDGTFTLGTHHDPFGAPPLIDGVYDIEAGTGDLVSQVVRAVRFEGGARRSALVLRLAPGGRLAGRVVTPDGDAAVGARLVVHPGDGSARRYEAVSDAQGRVALGPLAPGRYHVDAMHPSGVARTDVAIAAGSTAERTIELRRASRVTVVVRSTTGDSMSDVDVALDPVIAAAGTATRTRRTDAAGTARFDGLLPGDYELRATRAPHTTSRMSIRVDAGSNRHVTIDLRTPSSDRAKPGRKGSKR